MIAKNLAATPLRHCLILLLLLLPMVACNTTPDETCTGSEVPETVLLVREPAGPLPVNRPVTVKARTKDAKCGVSHIELVAVELPPNNQGQTFANVLVRADAPPFAQTTFTAEQTFVPTQRGDYLIKVKGYNLVGNWQESASIRFTAQ
ncbi:MAG: hypothetical protein D6768_03405 [Chloroflexi bacterium]|nr:MAG: hypothetical protein D6768_03405 [Chloroflexota bacterium]